LSVFIEIFDFEMANLRGYFRTKTYRQNLQRGREHLAAYYNFHSPSWGTHVLVEKNISTEVGGVPIKGVIDRLNFIDAETATITDYKTGSQNPKKIQGPTKKEPLGGTYWRQLNFYKILYENHKNTSVKVVSGEISYLEADSRGEQVKKTVLYESDGVNLVKEMMKTTYENIINHKFEEGCGEESCSWCQFLNEHKTVVSFADKGVEELDD
jgi:DNA helicase-2/ATP-dependent DNA helicase PcrA